MTVDLTRNNAVAMWAQALRYKTQRSRDFVGACTPTEQIVGNSLFRSRAQVASVDRLPPELLAYIFQVLQLLVGWPQLPNCSGPTLSEAATWIRVTWVCRYWRCVALDCPTLWASIVDSGWWNNATWLTTFLERSGETPLQLKLDDDDADLEAAVIAIRPLIHRVCRLELWTYDQPLSSVLAQLPGRFDVLEEAELSSCYCDPSDDSPVDDELHLSTGHFPSLRSLILANAHPAWETFSLANLNEFHVIDASTGPYTAATLRLMRDSPHLRIFKLDFTKLAPSLEPPYDAYGTISLAYLKEFRISGTPREVTYVLDRIIVPSTCSIGVCYTWNEHPGALSLIRSMFPYQLAFKNTVPHYVALTLHLGDDHVALFCSRGDGNISTSLRVSGEHPAVQSIVAEDTWSSLLGAFSSSPLTRINMWFYSDTSISFPMWITLFERFPLQAVQIGFPYTYSSQLWRLQYLFDALRAPCSSKVRLLELFDLFIDAALTDAIIDLLERRAATNIRLDTLMLFGCYLEKSLEPQEFKRRLEPYVKPVFK
ncbi:hypothetical protein BD311DRAFT_843660 [Dichomitus squalens]|uniref:Uncharacterized protein n=1 Tax=Dichomitus squalens TaxID=114155 RepID=A0A4Q9MM58_9APHY|nr:hypothetical protein BD311DRAFT_843660 [Dichomitus squalens]